MEASASSGVSAGSGAFGLARAALASAGTTCVPPPFAVSSALFFNFSGLLRPECFWWDSLASVTCPPWRPFRQSCEGKRFSAQNAHLFPGFPHAAGQCHGRGRIRHMRGEVHQTGPPDDLLACNESPVTAVLTVVTVVAHDKVMSFRHGNPAVTQNAPQLHPPQGIGIGGGGAQRREVIAESIRHGGGVDRVRLVQRHTIDEDTALAETKMVARETDHSFYQRACGIGGIVEDHKVAPVHG